MVIGRCQTLHVHIHVQVQLHVEQLLWLLWVTVLKIFDFQKIKVTTKIAYFMLSSIILIILYCGGLNQFSGPVNDFIIHYTYMLL